MIYGFTGSSKGMTSLQKQEVVRLLSNVTVLHHGDCIGSDEQANHIALGLNVRVVLHPPTDTKARAFCCGWSACRLSKPYLQRNREIVKEAVDGLIATPRNFAETPRRGISAGTWSTVRYARELGRKIWIIFPDGTIREE